MLTIERVGHVVLWVADVEKAQAFYRDVLGMEVTSSRPGKGVFLSFGSQHHDIALFQHEGTGYRGSLGLAHIALRLPGGDSELREAWIHLLDAGVNPDRATDHGITHSIYFKDADGNQLEIYTDVYPATEGMNVMRAKPDSRQPLEIGASTGRRS